MKEFIHEFDGVSDIVYVSSMVDDTVLFLDHRAVDKTSEALDKGFPDSEADRTV